MIGKKSRSDYTNLYNCLGEKILFFMLLIIWVKRMRTVFLLQHESVDSLS